ncbi:MFS transporter [Candidatus Albibeggiatoa sp. nov. NOAA]|uniref:MFS transporter n=1 Tax=Candidatus Albibeggiatoa sp. nov. NOAA TaxID=3162724 RepID=UPI0033003E50|nr:MFS transporter [Thiotrichaceae bacterium]
MNQTELKATSSLATIMALRMIGLFMILPVFALYAEQLEGTTPFLVGVAIGIYGLTQASLQIPFGMLSDRIGRKAVITIGLLIFALGSIVAAVSTDITGVIIGRALQGGGAIAAALLALTADLTYEEHRTKAMAMIGVTIGMSFIFALSIGPVLNHWIGVQGIFWTTAGLAIAAIIILHFVVPQPHHCRFHRDTEPVLSQFTNVFHDSQLMRLNIGIMILHCMLTALFVVMPLILQDKLPVAQHWMVYLPILFVSFVSIVPLIIIGEKKHHLKFVFVLAIGLLITAQVGFAYFHQSFWILVALLFVFFMAFNLLEASLPSLVSKVAPPENKGTAMGVYSSSQFLGAFIGGICGGWFHHQYNDMAVFLFCAVLAIIWFILAITMRSPRYLSPHMLNVGDIDKQQATKLTKQLAQIPGVAEAVVILEDGVAYLKIDRDILDMSVLDQFSIPEEARC